MQLMKIIYRLLVSNIVWIAISTFLATQSYYSGKTIEMWLWISVLLLSWLAIIVNWWRTKVLL